MFGKKNLRRIFFLPQSSPFIRAWYRHQETLECAPDGWVERIAVVLNEKIRNGTKVCETCTGYARWKQNRCAVKTYRKFQGQGRTTPGISVTSVSVCFDFG